MVFSWLWIADDEKAEQGVQRDGDERISGERTGSAPAPDKPVDKVSNNGTGQWSDDQT
jgi:hypothetical protein